MNERNADTQKPFDWRALAPEALERHYNPRAALSEEWVAGHLADYAARSAATSARHTPRVDIRYGDRPKETFDLFAPATEVPAPALIFIHGGYWRAMDKSDVSFVLEPVVAAGAVGINANYDLCPDVTLDIIVQEMRRLVAHVIREAGALGVDPARLYLTGHSAGAHLSAMLLAHDWAAEGLPARPFKGASLISGIYEPEIVRHISVNADVRLTEEMAQRNDCLARPPRYDLPVFLSVGGEEPEGWIAQSEAYRAACRRAGVDAVLHIAPGADHFGLLTEPLAPAGAFAPDIAL